MTALATEERFSQLLRPEFPSVRGAPSLVSGVGVDTMRVYGPSNEEFVRALDHQLVEKALMDSSVHGGVVRGKATVNLGLAVATLNAFRMDQRPFFSLELSLPTMLTAHNRNPLPVVDVVDVVEMSVLQLSTVWPGIPRLDQLAVSRLDVVQDFHDLQSPASTVFRLSQHQPPAGRRNKLERARDGAAQMLTRGSDTQWLARAYVKDHQLRELAVGHRHRDVLLAWAAVSGGQLRTEYELLRDVLHRAQLGRVVDVRPVGVEALARRYFNRSGFDVTTSGMDLLAHRFHELEAAGATDAQVRAVMSYVLAQHLGMEMPAGRGLKVATAALARRAGVWGVPLASTGTPRKLDFDAGTEIAVSGIF